MRLYEQTVGDSRTPGMQRVEVDAKRDKVASLSAAVVDSVLTSCKAMAGASLNDASSDFTSSCSGSICSSTELCTLATDGPAWDCLPDIALDAISKHLPAKSLAAARLACKAWVSNLSEALTEATPSTFLSGPSDTAGSSTVIVQLMREGAKCGQKDAQQQFMQKLESLNRHTGLQAALQQQLQHSLASWHDSLNKLCCSSPFLTKLDLSHCAAIVSADDYDQLLAVSSTHHNEACAGAVIRQRALPLNIETLLPLLQQLTCLQSTSLQLFKLSKKSIQMISWAMKVRWPGKPSSLTDIQISFAPAEEYFLGCPTLSIDTEDVIELTIYSGITQVNISNQSGVSDMAVAALSLLPNLGNMSLSGTQLSNLAMYVITTATNLTKLDLSKNPGITNEGIASLIRLTSLVSLDLSDCNNMSNPSLVALSRRMPLLQELSLHNCAHITDTGKDFSKTRVVLHLARPCPSFTPSIACVTNNWVAALHNNSSLTSLNLAVCREVTDQAVGFLASLPKLSKLDVTFCDRLTDAVVPHLARMRGLQDLTLACCKLSSAGVAGLSRLQGLTSLDLVGCVDGVTPGAAAALSKVSGLKSLNLAFCSMLMDSGAKALADLTMLTDLSLAYCKWVTDDGVAALSTLTALTSLNLQGCSQKTPHMGPHGLSALKHMTGLVNLNLGSCKLSPNCMQTLAELTQLIELSLRFCKGPRPLDFASISRLVRLEKLDLKGCTALSDLTMRFVQQLYNLRSLDISYSQQLTDVGVMRLTAMKELRHLAVAHCPRVTEACLDSLLLAVPSLRSLSSSESHDAEQLLSMHGFRSRNCYSTLPAVAIDNLPADMHHNEE